MLFRSNDLARCLPPKLDLPSRRREGSVRRDSWVSSESEGLVLDDERGEVLEFDARVVARARLDVGSEERPLVSLPNARLEPCEGY